MIRLQYELANKTSSHEILEKIYLKMREAQADLYLSDILVFQFLIDEFYRQELVPEEMEEFFSLSQVVKIKESESTPKENIDKISSYFTRLTGAPLNHLALTDDLVKNRYNHGLNMLYLI